MEYLISQACHPLSEFLEMMLHQYQIANVVSVMASKKDNRQNPVQHNATLNPLGMFSGFATVQAQAADEEMISLFQDILIDLPCGEYFRKFIDKIIASSREGDQNSDAVDMAQIGEKINSLSSADQLLRVKKIWKSDFHRWIMANCNECTREWMDDVLKAEADWETLQVHYMGFLPRRGGGDAGAGKDMFRNLQHNLGNLYPARSEQLA